MSIYICIYILYYLEYSLRWLVRTYNEVIMNSSANFFRNSQNLTGITRKYIQKNKKQNKKFFREGPKGESCRTIGRSSEITLMPCPIKRPVVQLCNLIVYFPSFRREFLLERTLWKFGEINNNKLIFLEYLGSLLN